MQPHKFEMEEVLLGRLPQLMNGYCNSRKDTIVLYQESGTKAWTVVHKPTQTNLNSIVPERVSGLYGHLDFIRHLTTNASEEIRVIDRLPVRPTALSEEARSAMASMKQVAREFRC